MIPAHKSTTAGQHVFPMDSKMKSLSDYIRDVLTSEKLPVKEEPRKFKPFFVHYMTQNLFWPDAIKRNGFTVYVSPRHDDNINVQVTYCSKKDNFSRAEGRINCQLKNAFVMHRKTLPIFLEECAKDTVYNEEYIPEGYFEFVTRNFR